MRGIFYRTDSANESTTLCSITNMIGEFEVDYGQLDAYHRDKLQEMMEMKLDVWDYLGEKGIYCEIKDEGPMISTAISWKDSQGGWHDLFGILHHENFNEGLNKTILDAFNVLQNEDVNDQDWIKKKVIYRRVPQVTEAAAKRAKRIEYWKNKRWKKS